ncbi:MAG: 1-acyl-sn-glycerol-3-phosphate acyltransferase [Saprospiraceae bacterium]|nr:1-acyl-sn-glycerol-3-phosphate acyltransferase [Saprospiraceae bacterium]
MGWFARMILKLIGWKATGHEKLYNLPKYIIAIGPHTSNWDFPLGILIRAAYGLYKVRFLGKESLFKPPFGFIFRALGGYPVVRSKHINQVDSYIQVFNENPEFAIVVAPEGTRKKVDRLKTGFYYIAKGANIPIIPTIMNYETKSVDFSNAFYAGNSDQEDIRSLEDFFRNRPGKYPELSF